VAAEDEQGKANIRKPTITPLAADMMTETFVRTAWCGEDETTAFRPLKRSIENLLLEAAMWKRLPFASMALDPQELDPSMAAIAMETTTMTPLPTPSHGAEETTTPSADEAHIATAVGVIGALADTIQSQILRPVGHPVDIENVESPQSSKLLEVSDLPV
jgi:hypothetical protein